MKSYTTKPPLGAITCPVIKSPPSPAKNKATRAIRLSRKRSALKEGIHPCYSGFQVQGSATPPTGMTSFRSPTLLTLLL